MYGSIRNIAIPSLGIPQGILILENLIVQISQPLKKNMFKSPTITKNLTGKCPPPSKEIGVLLLTSCKFTDETAKYPPYSAYRLYLSLHAGQYAGVALKNV